MQTWFDAQLDKKKSERFVWFLMPKNDSEKCLFSIYADVVWCPTWLKNLERYLVRTASGKLNNTFFVYVLTRLWSKGQIHLAWIAHAYPSLFIKTKAGSLEKGVICLHVPFILKTLSDLKTDQKKDMHASDF